MHRWLSSLQFRLIAGFALILALVLGSVSITAGYAAGREAERFERQVSDARAARIQRFVARHYMENQGWANVQAALDQADPISGRRLIVTDLDGKVVGDSHQGPAAPLAPSGAGASTVPIVVNGRRVGSLAVAPGRLPRAFQEPAADRVASAVNQSLVWTGLAAAAGGVFLVCLLSRRVLSPVQALSAAAQELGQGNLAQRVPVSGPAELSQLSRTFNAMAENLEIAEKQRRNLVADVAHELRTPLSNVQGYLEAIKDGVLKPDEATINIVYQQVQHLVRLVEDLRLLAQAEAGALRLDRQPASLTEVLNESVKAFRPRAESKGVSLSLEAPEGLPPVELDRTRIAQVLDNLLENAIFHTPAGKGVVVSVARTPDGQAGIAVADQGSGIPREDLPLVFERFYRVDPSRARSTGGTGLGLTIARKLVEAHGGVISAESALGQGSRFVFRLPFPAEKSNQPVYPQISSQGSKQ